MSKKLFLNINSLAKAKNFVEKTNTFDCDIDLISGRYIIDAKSILGVLSVNILETLQVVISTEDENEIKRFNDLMEEFK